MEFISTFLTSGVEMIVFMGIMVCGIVIGKKLRDKKDEKNAVQQKQDL
ncbi:hypothetical protein C8E03_101834 [Lachnotalea glycerini]|uniref:Uncharacterized protein n=1 Tax=Lachnotalea glycerini TaxID=1763509 RepID=A0A318ETG0_9FIRM|nr:hypothetical protein [Lachnotalea glycerini]PXV96199.1 hypothetical protein C8E03_101834 [Lachnotalea glycerini]